MVARACRGGSVALFSLAKTPQCQDRAKNKKHQQRPRQDVENDKRAAELVDLLPDLAANLAKRAARGQ